MLAMRSLTVPPISPTPASPPSDRRALAVWALVLGLVSLLPPLALITGPVAVILGLVVLVRRRPGRGMALAGGTIGALSWVALSLILILIVIVAIFGWGFGGLGVIVFGFEGGVTRQEAVGVFVQRHRFATEILQLRDDGTYVQTVKVDNDAVPRTNQNRWRFVPTRGNQGDVELIDPMLVAYHMDSRGRDVPRWDEVARPGWWEPFSITFQLLGTKTWGRFGGGVELECDPDGYQVYTKNTW